MLAADEGGGVAHVPHRLIARGIGVDGAARAGVADHPDAGALALGVRNVAERAGHPQRIDVGLRARDAVLVRSRVDPPEPELVHERIPDRPAVRDLPIRRVLLEHAVAWIDHVGGGRVPIRRPGIADECAPDAGEILITTQGELILVLRKRPHGDVVALWGGRVGRRKPVVPQRELGEARESRLRDDVVRERLPGQRIDDGRAEASGEFVGLRHGVETRGPALDTRAFIVDQEGPVMAAVGRQHHGPAGDESKLFLIELRRRRAPVVEKVAGVPSFVPEEAEAGAVQRVGAGLADDIDLIRAESVLRGVGRRLLLEFLNRVDGEHGCRRAERGVDVRGAVDHEIVRRRARAHDADGVADALPHRALLATGLHRTRAEKQQTLE